MFYSILIKEKYTGFNSRYAIACSEYMVNKSVDQIILVEELAWDNKITAKTRRRGQNLMLTALDMRTIYQ